MYEVVESLGSCSLLLRGGERFCCGESQTANVLGFEFQPEDFDK
jgi:hypothetical protein